MNNQINVATMNVNNIVEKLAKSYCALIKNNNPIKLMPSIMLWGAPGVGKSQAVRQIGKIIEEETNKKVNITDVRLLLFNPIDLRGIPTSNEDKTLAVWLKPKIFQMDESSNVINILFLDEISAAPASVQAAAYQITLDRVVGEHKLPENCIVMAAGNRVTDKSVAYKMPKALANRLLHIDVEADFSSWKNWAVKNSINHKVVGFLSFRNDFLMKFEPSNDDLAFPTPRSWELVSNLLNYISEDVDEIFNLIAGLVGMGAAIEFRTWCKVYKSLPNIEDIFEGKNPKAPTSTSALYALIASMVNYARKHKNEIYKIANSIRYSSNLPADFAFILIGDYMAIEKDYKQMLMQIPEFVKILQTKGKYLNGN